MLSSSCGRELPRAVAFVRDGHAPASLFLSLRDQDHVRGALRAHIPQEY